MAPTDTNDHSTASASLSDPLDVAVLDLEALMGQELPSRLTALGIDLTVLGGIHVMEPTYVERVLG